ncbi:uncharacterized protein [Branchiostoma lanceolatum]|uniref:uncharacterized protein isoform X1 n=1 Tax=Branchiostoma lanceolatum TaxID=7740 RepID=UPI003455872B
MASKGNGVRGPAYSSDDSGIDTTAPLAIATGDPTMATVVGCAIVILVWILSFRQYLSRTRTGDGSEGRGLVLHSRGDPVSWKETRVTFDLFRFLGSFLAAEVMFPFPPSDSGVSLFSLTAIDLVSSVVYFLLVRREEFKKQLKHYTAFNFTTTGFSYGFTLQLLIISHHYNPTNVLINTLILLYILAFCLITWNAVGEVMKKLELDPSERSALKSVVYSMCGVTLINTMYYTWPTSIPYILCIEHLVPRTLSQVLIPLWILLVCSQIITYRNISSSFHKEDSKSAVLHHAPDATHNCGICCSGLILAWFCDGRRAPTDIITYWKPLWPLLLADIMGIIGYCMACNQFSSIWHAKAEKASEDEITQGASAPLKKSVAVKKSESAVDGTEGSLEMEDEVREETSMPPMKPMGVDATDEVLDGAATSLTEPMDVKVTDRAAGETTTLLPKLLDVGAADEVVDGTAVSPMKLVEVEAAEELADGTATTPVMSMDVETTDEVVYETAMSPIELVDVGIQCQVDGQVTSLTKPVDAMVTDEEDDMEEDDSWATDEEEKVEDEESTDGSALDERMSDSEISVTTSADQSVPVCSIILPPRAPGKSLKITSAFLNPDGHLENLKLKENELLVSDIIKINPSGLTFSGPVRFKIPHSLPKYDEEWQYIVVASSDDGSTWEELETESCEESGQRSAIVETTHLGQFAVKARPLKHTHRIKKGKATKLKSSKETGVEVSLPSDSVSKDEEISFEVTPVDKAALSCAGRKDATVMADTHCMSHILKFSKGSGLLLKRPATIVIPLTSSADGKEAHVLSCTKKGEWEDITDKVDDIVLEHSKVAFKTDRLRDGFAALVSKSPSDSKSSVKIIDLVSKSVHASEVKLVVFKKWKEPREEGVMTVRIESIIEDYVEDRIVRRTTTEGYDLQSGTPTAVVTMVENETFCAYFKGNIHPPNCDLVNGLLRANLTFHSAAPCTLTFDVKVDEKKESSDVGIYSGPKETCPVPRHGELPAAPLAKMEITTPTGITCEYWLKCRKFKNTLGIEDHHFNLEGDMCYCYRCHNERGDRDWYHRGDPPEMYAIPQGWSRFGVRVNPAFMDKDLPAFDKWHRAFHGTDPVVVKKILQSSSQLLIPGDTVLGGHRLGEKPGHITPDSKPEGFDTRQVFVSPSIKYAGCEVYASPQRYKDKKGKEYDVRVALQLCVRPGSYTVGPETIGARREGRTIDPLFSNDELEWFTKERGGHALYGLLVKMDPK